MSHEHRDRVDGIVARMATAQQRERARDAEDRHRRGRARLVEAVEAPAARDGGWWRAGGLAAVTAVAAVLLVWGLWPAALTYTVSADGPQPDAQGYVVAERDRPRTLQFSDGSAFELHPGTRVRVGERRRHGADLELDHGALVAMLESGDDASDSTWAISAGPYHVVLRGTAATVRWDGRDAFEVEAHRGRAEVRGPGIEGTRMLEVGERLVRGAAAPSRLAAAVTAARGDEPSSPDAVPADAPAEPAVEPIPRRTPPARAAGPDRAARADAPAAADWRSLARAGDYPEALAAAEADGFAKLCRTLGSDALLELADLGRYARRPARAREALSALRRRFAGTEAAAAAAFDLGRLAGDPPEGCAKGRAWYETYLRERPQGAMAEAARRRLEECDDAVAARADGAP